MKIVQEKINPARSVLAKDQNKSPVRWSKRKRIDSYMKTGLALFILVLATLSCQPPKGRGGANGRMVPYNLNATMADRGFDLTWQCDISDHISGYNIYAYEHSFEKSYADGVYPEDIKPINNPVFPGDTDATDGIEHYLAAGLKNGKRYFVTVRVVYPDQTLSAPAQEIMIVPGPSGLITMAERFKGDNDGFSFEKNRPSSADAAQNDLFFHVQNGSRYLASPTRLGGFLNQTLLVKLPYKGEYHQVRQLVNDGEVSPVKDRVEVSGGDWVLAKLASGKHALIKVSGFQHTTNQTVTLEYYLCTLTAGIHF